MREASNAIARMGNVNDHVYVNIASMMHLCCCRNASIVHPFKIQKIGHTPMHLWCGCLPWRAGKEGQAERRGRYHRCVSDLQARSIRGPAWSPEIADGVKGRQLLLQHSQVTERGINAAVFWKGYENSGDC